MHMVCIDVENATVNAVVVTAVAVVLSVSVIDIAAYIKTEASSPGA